MSNEQEVIDALISSVKGEKADYKLAVVEFRNETPSGYDAVIVAMGAAFFYKDPSNEKPTGNEQQQRPGPLRSGQSSYVQGTRAECCARVVAAMTVLMGGETKTYQSRSEVPAGRCLLRAGFNLRPARSVDPNELSSGDLPLELVFVE
ncbi:hypothetical protein [Achromobacter xylosoxidans]|uniref:hypothetical protein n=1 Tax=Alcaligenes xylosoxydans xylosoxydans TaxID=85698 RepID=UPI001178BA18|nr:hypothetical protein [Achromobacter xylosoxidans]